jgi:hypothetical protein
VLALRQALAMSRTKLHRHFFASCAEIIDTPWQIAAASDLAIPGVHGEASLATRIVNRYLHRLFHAAQYDSAIALAFVRVVQMIASPASLFRPATLFRVLWQNVLRSRKSVRRQADSEVERQMRERRVA